VKNRFQSLPFKCNLQRYNEEKMNRHIDSVFIFSLTWSIGGSANSNQGRASFDEFFRAAYACALEGGYAGPSGEKYILAEDIPAGHMTTETPAPPASGVTKPTVGRCTLNQVDP
jgi:hypothetical protein